MASTEKDSFLAHLRASYDAGRAGAMAEAALQATAAVAAAGHSDLSNARAALALAKTGESFLAHQAIETIGSAEKPHSREVLEATASALHALKRHAPALVFARRATEAGSIDPAWGLFQATLEMFCGNTAAAQHLLERCLHEKPDMVSAHWTLAKLQRHSTSNNHVDRLHRQIRMRSQQDESLPYLFFALFKELDDIGDTKAAWQALVRGCLAWRRTVQYELQGDLEGLSALASAFPPPRPVAEVQAPADGVMPIFIVGLPRSGTTLVERILGGHSMVHASGELDDLSATMVHAAGSRFYFDAPPAAMARRLAESNHSAIAQRYLRNTSWRADGRPRFTDKRPNNFMHVASIARAMPWARIVHVHKQPMDGCFSLLKELFGGRYNYSYRLSELAAYHGAYRQLMRHWRDSGLEFLDVSYEKLVQDPEAEARRIIAYCGLEWEPQCMHTDRLAGAIATASVAQAREPVTSRYVEAWKRYASELGPLQEILDSKGS